MKQQLAFVVKLLFKVITENDITDDELQALMNIKDELPDVEASNFRW